MKMGMSRTILLGLPEDGKILEVTINVLKHRKIEFSKIVMSWGCEFMQFAVLGCGARHKD